MKRILLISAFFFLTIGLKAQNVPYCNLQGAIYVAPTKQGAEYWVYVEESEAFADMLVFEEENKLYADEPGIWYFVETKGLADYSIYFTKEKSEADFSIYYTDSSTFSGCK
jgi:hypothetical protein